MAEGKELPPLAHVPQEFISHLFEILDADKVGYASTKHILKCLRGSPIVISLLNRWSVYLQDLLFPSTWIKFFAAIDAGEDDSTIDIKELHCLVAAAEIGDVSLATKMMHEYGVEPFTAKGRWALL